MKTNTYIAIIIPIYKTTISWSEEISLSRARDILRNYSLIFVAPKKLDVNGFVREDEYIERFEDYYFEGIKGYNSLLLSRDFYARFSDYKYILIYQLDAFVFKDRLMQFTDKDIDYIGAPWLYYYRNHNVAGLEFEEAVGNGGFSLRKVRAMIHALDMVDKEQIDLTRYNEDVIFSYCGFRGYMKLADEKCARKFASEMIDSEDKDHILSNLPCGCHAWTRYSSKTYIRMFKAVGIDISEYERYMRDEDVEFKDKHEYGKYIDSLFENEIDFFQFMGFAHTDNISIYGFGNYGKKAYLYFKKHNYNVVGIYDNSNEKIGTLVDGIEIKSGKDIRADGSPILIFNYSDEQMVKELEERGLKQGESLYSFYNSYLSQ